MPALRPTLISLLTLLILPGVGGHLRAQGRAMQPADLFNLERIGAIAWSPDRRTAAIEIHRPSRWLDTRIPTAGIAVLDVESGTLRTVSPMEPEIIGFFRPAWSPDGRRLLFLSVDENAIVRPWIWNLESRAATLLDDMQLADATADPPTAFWSDSFHVVLMLRDSSYANDGPLYFAIQRGRNVADHLARAREANEPAVMVLDSWGSAAQRPASDERYGQRRIVSVDVRTQAVDTIATGPLHRLTLSGDGRTLTYWRESPSFGVAEVASFFGPEAQGDGAYDRVNWGSEVHHIDLATGATVREPPAVPPTPSPSDQPTVRVTNTTEGTRLLLARPGRPEIEVWQGNGWVREIRMGHTEAISYESLNGQPLTGWILYPPEHIPGRSIPILTVIYPGVVYGVREPSDFDIFRPNFLHPQVFARLGYGVVLPSMPTAENPLQADALAELTAGVLPLLDTLVVGRIVDSSRIAVVGQSAGGWATLGLISQSDRFRTAIASASYSNLVSLYGTFYGQFRYGDAGDPRRAQVLRMLQFERGFFGAGSPPWELPEQYRMNSPLWRVADVRTPLMLIHGDADYIPVQQAEEFFSALYRLDRRARFVRYAGEWHTITARANVLDLWDRLEAWLAETMPPDH